MLDGDTVMYGGAFDLRATLDYDFSVEKEFSYKGLSVDETIKHLAVFISKLWQIHIFGEGNTRTTAVFFIKYLRTLGFDVTNDIFAENAWYFRNSLVRANYTNLKKDIHETTEFLELFLRNLLLGEKNELKNRYLHIKSALKCQNVTIDGTINVTIDQIIVFRLLKENSKITQKQIAEKINKSERTVKRIVEELRKNGYIVREGSSRLGYWKILKDI